MEFAVGVVQLQGRKRPHHPAVRLLDWEMVELGSGLQDLGQYVLSGGGDLVRAYYCITHELIHCGVDDEDETNSLWDY